MHGMQAEPPAVAAPRRPVPGLLMPPLWKRVHYVREDPGLLWAKDAEATLDGEPQPRL